MPVTEPATIGSHPRDDVVGSWARDGRERSGSATIHDADGTLLGTVVLGDLRVVQVDRPVGTELEVRITARYDGQSLERTARLRVTREETDVVTVAVGPGVTVERGFLGRRTHHGFECGVLAMGAVVLA